MTEYYDVILGLIPVAVLGLGGGLHVVGFAQSTAVTIGGLVAVALVVHALFVNAPRDTPVAEPSTTESSGATPQAAD